MTTKGRKLQLTVPDDLMGVIEHYQRVHAEARGSRPTKAQVALLLMEQGRPAIVKHADVMADRHAAKVRESLAMDRP